MKKKYMIIVIALIVSAIGILLFHELQKQDEHKGLSMFHVEHYTEWKSQSEDLDLLMTNGEGPWYIKTDIKADKTEEPLKITKYSEWVCNDREFQMVYVESGNPCCVISKLNNKKALWVYNHNQSIEKEKVVYFEKYEENMEEKSDSVLIGEASFEGDKMIINLEQTDEAIGNRTRIELERKRSVPERVIQKYLQAKEKEVFGYTPTYLHYEQVSGDDNGGQVELTAGIGDIYQFTFDVKKEEGNYIVYYNDEKQAYTYNIE